MTEVVAYGIPAGRMTRHHAVESRQQLADALGDRFVLGDLLGRGGFAEVWKAHEVALDRPVAIKVLLPETAQDPSLAERFLREARAMARLAHPNIVQIHATGESSGLVWVAMQFVDGESLRERLDREGALTADDARRILDHAACALEAAHAAGIIHRDVKPDNILLTRDGRALLTDFGIARAQQAASATLTGTGLIIGTPHYMSPEQGSGDGTLDHRADIYSIGVVGYHLLAGRLPFDADNPLVIMMKHATELPPPLSAARPDAPPELVAAIDRCLRKRPDDRWSSAAEFRQALAGAAPAMTGNGGARVVTPASRTHGMKHAAIIAGIVAVAAIAGELVLDAGGLLALGGVAAAGFVTAAGYGERWRMVNGDLPDQGRGSSQRLRVDRAAVLAMLARVPRGEREALAPVRRAMDDLVVRGLECERVLRAGPSQADEDANIQRAIHEQSLVRYRSVSGELRRAVRRVWSDGYARSSTEVDQALATYTETVRRGT